jgi:uncharacterized protein
VGEVRPSQEPTKPLLNCTRQAKPNIAVESARRLGGEVLSAEDTQWTRTALIRDPQGAVFTASQFKPAG